MWASSARVEAPRRALPRLKLTKNFLRGYIVFHVVRGDQRAQRRRLRHLLHSPASRRVARRAVSYRRARARSSPSTQKRRRREIATGAERARRTTSSSRRRTPRAQIRQTANYMCARGVLVARLPLRRGHPRLVVYRIGALHAGVTFALVFVCRFVGSAAPGSMRGEAARRRASPNARTARTRRATTSRRPRILAARDRRRGTPRANGAAVRSSRTR